MSNNLFETKHIPKDIRKRRKLCKHLNQTFCFAKNFARTRAMTNDGHKNKRQCRQVSDECK